VAKLGFFFKGVSILLYEKYISAFFLSARILLHHHPPKTKQNLHACNKYRSLDCTYHPVFGIKQEISYFKPKQ
jgi:hypothetical protein